MMQKTLFCLFLLSSPFFLSAGDYALLSDKGRATEDDLISFLIQGNPGLEMYRAREFAVVYMQEAAEEGINHDLAFSQMCLETGFLKFGGQVDADQNNFCGLGALDGSARGAAFPSLRMGVRAHIQHLKAYSGDLILSHDVIDPRFYYVRGNPVIRAEGLSGRWASDPFYGEKIRNLIISLYRDSELYN